MRRRGQSFEGSVTSCGQRYRASFKDPAEARAWEHDARAALLRGQTPRVQRHAVTGSVQEKRLDDVATRAVSQLWGNRASELLAASVLRIASKMLRNPRVSDLDCQELIAGWRAAGLRASTINRRRTVLLRFCAWAVDEGLMENIPNLEKEPFSVVDGRLEGRRSRFLTRPEEASLIARLKSDAHRQLAVFLVNTGLRLGEASSLSWDDVDLNDRLLTVRTGKTGDARTVPLCGAALEVLWSRLEKALPVGPWRACVARDFQRDFQQAREAAGIDDRDVVPHCLRHTYATRLVSAGVSIQEVSRVLGHRQLQQTMVYAHREPAVLDKIREALDA